MAKLDMQFLYTFAKKVEKISGLENKLKYSAHTTQIKKIAEIIYRKTKDRSVIKSLLRSYIPMSVNRFFISDNRVYEMFLTDFLARYYRGKIYKWNKSL